jgi:hypothetical protein
MSGKPDQYHPVKVIQFRLFDFSFQDNHQFEFLHRTNIIVHCQHSNYNMPVFTVA